MTESTYLVAEFGNGSTPSSATHSTKYSASERVAHEYYQDQGYEVVGLDSGVSPGELSDDLSLPNRIQERLRDALKQNHDLSPLESEYPLSFIQNIVGVPDFFIYSPDQWREERQYSFVEVKIAGTGLNRNQLHWASNIDHFPYRIVYVSEISEKPR